MKKPLLLALLSVFFFSIKTMGQCNPGVPSNAVVVNFTDTIDGGFDPIWVCSGDTLRSNGGFHNTFLEAGAVMKTDGGIDTIYVKNGASIFMNGGIDVIYYETITDLHIFGGITTQVSCSPLTFNYSNAPPNGCTLQLSAAFETSDTSICSGTCISFESLSSNATSWSWSFPGATPSTSNDDNPTNICYNSTGSYDVTLIVTNSSGSDTLTQNNYIDVNSALATPVLTQSNDTLFSSLGYATYQWYFESVLISGATNYFYVAGQSGIYTVVVTGDNGCGNATASISYIATGMDEVINSNVPIIIFPNPASELVTLQINSLSGAPCDISIVDLLGRNSINQTFTPKQGMNELKFDFSNRPPGVYFVKYNSAGIQYSRKLVIVH